jgi:hypothetical protein
MILESFIKECLDDPTRVNEKHIDVTGRLKDKSNKIESFCVRTYKQNEDTLSQSLSSKSNADRMVFAFDKHWVILDVNEIKKYSKINKKTKLSFNELCNKTDWVIMIKRYDN